MDTSTTMASATAPLAGRTRPARRPARTAASLDEFVLDGWLVQPALGRLSRGETTLRLRRQLMDLLVCLACGNGRTVGRQELLDAVWDDRLVGGTAIARSVAELRQVLGDCARQPRVIETIPKRGYRVIAPVAWEVGVRESRDAATLGSPDPPDTRLVTGFWPLIALVVVVATLTLLLLTRLAS